MRRLALLATAALALAGCSDDVMPRPSSTAQPRLSRQEFVTKANAICRKYQRKIEALGRPQANPESIERFMDRVIPLVKAGIAEERQLRPPQRDQRRWNEVLAANDELVEAAERLRSAARRRDVLTMQDEFEKLTAGDEKTDRLGRRLGLSDCARD